MIKSLRETERLPCAKPFAVCRFTGTWQTIYLPCARKTAYGKRTAHGKHNVCRVPNQPIHSKLQHTVNIFRLTWGDKKKRTAQRGTRQRCLLCRVPTVRLTGKMPQLLRQAVARLVRRVPKRTHGKSIFLPCVLCVCRVQTSWHTAKI